MRARANVVHIVMEVRTRGATAAEALEENSRRDEAVRRRLRNAGVHEESIDVSGVSFLAASGDGISLPGATEAQGFLAVRTLAVSIYLPEEDAARLPSRVAHLLDEAAEGGAQAGTRQQVNLAIFRSPCVTYGLENDEGARREALRRAMIIARTAAEESASALGVELGEIASTQVLELGALVQARVSASAFAIPGLDSPRPSEAGRISVRASIAVTYRVRSRRPFPEREEASSGSHFTLGQPDTVTHPGQHSEMA